MSSSKNEADPLKLFDDSMQETFLKAYARLGEFQGGSRFYTWLVRIAVNESLMRLRRRRPYHFSIDEPLPSDPDGLPLDLEDWDPNPEEKYASSEMNDVLAVLIERMDISCRTVLVLRDIEQLSAQQTADALGLSVASVKTRLLRARLMLRESLNLYFRKAVPK